MADLTRQFEIIFSGNSTDLNDTLKGIDRNFDGFTAKIESFAEPLSQVTDGILAMDAALVGLVVGGLAVSISKAGEFGDQFGEIATLIDIPRESLDGFSKDILDYSRDSRKSIDDINAAIYTAISAGIDYEDSLSLLTLTEKLSIAGRADLESTTRLVASSLNAYGESVDQAERYSDIFFTTVKLGQTTIPELATSLSLVTGTAAAAKIPVETLSAAIAALTATGAPTSQAITGINAAITNIISPSEQAIALAKHLEIGFNAEALEAKGLDGVLRDVQEATGGNVEEMTQLFGSIQGFKAAVVLASDESGKFKEALAAMSEAAGATAKAWGKVKDDFTNINQQIANNVNATLTTLGNQLLDEYGQVASGIISVLKGIGKELDGGTFDPLINAVEKFGVDLGQLLEGIAKAMPEAFDNVDFTGLLEALGEMGEELGGLFDNLDLTDPKDLGKAIQGVVDTVESLLRISASMAESLKPFFETIKEGIIHINNLSAADQEVLGNILVSAKLIATAGVEVVAAIALIQSSGGDMGRTFDGIFGVIKIGVNAIQTAFDALVWGVATGIEQLLFHANLMSFGQIDGLSEALASVKEFKSAVGSHLVEQVGDMAEGWDLLAGNVVKTGTAINDIPAKVTTELSLTRDELLSDPAIQALLDGKTVATKEIAISTKIDPALQEWADVANKELAVKVALEYAGTEEGILDKLGMFREADGTYTNKMSIQPEVDQDKAAEARAELDKEFTLKTLELETSFDIASLEAQAETAQAALEFKAQVDIAEIEASVKTIESLGDGIESIFASTGDTISTLFSEFSDLDLGSHIVRGFIEDLYDNENELRQKALDLQEKLTDAQIEYMDARTRALDGGDALISVSADGLEAELEAFMFKILERLQIRVAAEQAEFLLGV